MWNYPVAFALAVLQQEAATPASTPLPSAQDGGGFGKLLWLLLGLGIGLVIGALLSRAFSKTEDKPAEKESSDLSIYSPPRAAPAKRVALRGRRCPVCNSTYTDEALIYCVSDGASLVSLDSPREYDPKATMLYPDSPE